MNNSDKDIFEDAKLWDFPSVDEQHSASDSTTNALNRPSGRWKFEAPEEEQDITPLTAEDIEAIRASAYQEGFASGHTEGVQKGFDEGIKNGTEQGLEEGRASGLESGKEEAKDSITTQKAAFESLMNELHQPIANIQTELQKELVILAQTLAQSVIKVESQQNEKVLLNAIEEGMKALPIQEAQYHIMVNPEDLAWIQSHFDEQHMQDNKWTFIANEELSQGGCKIQTLNNAVDVSIEKRCDQIFSQLLFDQGVADDPRAR